LWVNSEKYVFSPDVLKAGEQLFTSFCKIKHLIRSIYNRICEEPSHANVTEVVVELKDNLDEFDGNWVNFEQVTFRSFTL
jgi:hypothetical protein